MTGSVALDVVIGLVFIYLLYSLLGSLIQEIIATSLSFRGKILEKAIARMLDDAKDRQPFMDRLKTWGRLIIPFNLTTLLKKKGLSQAFYDHPEIKYKSEDAWHKRPSSFSADNFAKVLVDLLRGSDVKPGDDIRSKIDESIEKGAFHPVNVDDADSPVSRIDPETLFYLKSLWVDAQGDVEEFKRLLERWYDQMMERTIGWYKKYCQVVLLFIGLGIAIVFNVDTVLIVKKLSSDPELRTAMIKQTEVFLEAHPNLEQEMTARLESIDQLLASDTTGSDSLRSLKKSTLARYDSLVAHRDTLISETKQLIETDIQNVNDLMGLGWSSGECHADHTSKCSCWCMPVRNGGNSIFGSLMGWLLTALAISLGAPFWFDLLNKLMKLRSSIQTTTTSQKDKSTSGSNNIKRVG
ncbi:hypothetical protein [Reichenbachiella sp. MSK19-1]|uniref:hypothetical protein n=1 Tax=Reichenbachiella sp. MSK19-1 TaxID=1897631 RepID=UPI000E6B6564|nr:hypothetical protein [Reichenbachiella sp. MSK19-1]RJE72446.1 hypothetical protein BGP76_00205 [Reichenbachiella sp. MSK19-1]